MLFCCDIRKLSTSFVFLCEIPVPFQLVSLHFGCLMMFHKALQQRAACTHHDLSSISIVLISSTRLLIIIARAIKRCKNRCRPASTCCLYRTLPCHLINNIPSCFGFLENKTVSGFLLVVFWRNRHVWVKCAQYDYKLWFLVLVTASQSRACRRVSLQQQWA